MPRNVSFIRAFQTNCFNKSGHYFEEKIRWKTVLNEAEKVVGYPTSFLSPQWILNDEIANVANHVRKLIGTDQSLLRTARNLLLKNELPTWGLVVLLVSKAAGCHSKFPDLEYDRIAGILHSQRTIAKVIEMLKTSHLIHKNLINIDPDAESASDLQFGNKLALLCGDYLLSASFQEVARLKNFQVQEIISTSVRDLAESQFVGPRDDQNQPLPTKPDPNRKVADIPFEFGPELFNFHEAQGDMRAEWTLRNVMGGAGLLAKGCQCSLILAGHDEAPQNSAHSLGRHLALAWQACIERNVFKTGASFGLTSAPVMFHLEHDPGLYEEILKGERNVDDVNYEKVRRIVLDGPSMEKTHKLQKEFARRALEDLEGFEESDSKRALTNIIGSL